jgi:hypothetical protein
VLIPGLIVGRYEVFGGCGEKRLPPEALESAGFEEVGDLLGGCPCMINRGLYNM